MARFVRAKRDYTHSERQRAGRIPGSGCLRLLAKLPYASFSGGRGCVCGKSRLPFKGSNLFPRLSKVSAGSFGSYCACFFVLLPHLAPIAHAPVKELLCMVGGREAGEWKSWLLPLCWKHPWRGRDCNAVLQSARCLFFPKVSGFGVLKYSDGHTTFNFLTLLLIV